MRPIGNNVIVQTDPQEEKLIIVRAGAEEAPNTGTIVEVGSKVEEVMQGDRVMYTDSFASKPVPGNEGMIVMDQSSILLIL